MGKHHKTVEAEDTVEDKIYRKSSDECTEDVDYMAIGEAYAEEDLGSEVKKLEEVASPDKANGPSSSSDKEDIEEVDGEIHAELLTLPPNGSEVFIGGLTHDTSEEYVRDLCEPFGKVFKLKLVKDKDANKNKGHAFVTFTTKDAANNAIKEIGRKGKNLWCSLYQQNHKLFIGSIPKSLKEEELRKILEETGPGIENIEFFKNSQLRSRNSVCAFVEYYNHACAEYARRKLTCADFKLDGSTPTVSWADGNESSDDSDSDSPAAAKPIIIGIGRVPSGMRLVRIMLPDGQLAYMLQPKNSCASSPPSRRRYRSGHFSDNSDRANDQSGCRRYRPY